MASEIPLYIDAGSTHTLIHTWTDPVSGLPINMTGYTAKMQIRRTPGAAGAPVLEFNIGTGFTLNGPLGELTLVITHTQTSSLTGQYSYDIEVTSPGGVRTRLQQGIIYVNPETTR